MADEYVNMDQETQEMGNNVKHTDYIYDLGESGSPVFIKTGLPLSPRS